VWARQLPFWSVLWRQGNLIRRDFALALVARPRRSVETPSSSFRLPRRATYRRNIFAPKFEGIHYHRKKGFKSGVFARGIGYSFRLTKYFSKASLFSAQIDSSICRLTRCQRTEPDQG
jgi:hypothetical protein